MSSKKILILVPSPTAKGGISNYFQVLKPLFSPQIKYLTRGARNWPLKTNKLSETFRFIKDNLLFVQQLLNPSIKVVQTNTSLSKLGVLRDGLFIVLALIFRKKVVVFFRGWDENFEAIIEKKYLNLFKSIYFKSSAFIVLSKHQEKKLKLWGFVKKIYNESTLVDQKMLENFDIEKSILERSNNKKFEILFLSRVEIAKGIYEVIDTFKILQEIDSNYALSIAGEGFELENVKTYVLSMNLNNVKFLGHIQGEDKIKAYQHANTFIFPSYTEGMPNVILEAMAFGLPIITRKIGALPDFFIHNEHGFITDSKSPEEFSSFIEKLRNDTNLRNKISLTNYSFAKNKFYSSNVVKRLENIYNEVISN